MANWNKLNAEFDNLINNLTDSDWDKWAAESEQRKAQRKSEILSKAQIQENKITATVETPSIESLCCLHFDSAKDNILLGLRNS